MIGTIVDYILYSRLHSYTDCYRG